eukprot:6180817-Pleurochrysis_carterae.AAC.2
MLMQDVVDDVAAVLLRVSIRRSSFARIGRLRKLLRTRAILLEEFVRHAPATFPFRQAVVEAVLQIVGAGDDGPEKGVIRGRRWICARGLGDAGQRHCGEIHRRAVHKRNCVVVRFETHVDEQAFRAEDLVMLAFQQNLLRVLLALEANLLLVLLAFEANLLL